MLVNKSEMIRSVLVNKPNAKPREIKAILVNKGVLATSQFISVIKNRFEKIGGPVKLKRGRPRISYTKNRVNTIIPVSKSCISDLPVSQLIELSQTVKKVGGIAKMREALSILEKLS